ncbi:MAG: site-2 protease family protein [Vicinamibacteria bacterium]|jgi:Zn-dependent protease
MGPRGQLTLFRIRGIRIGVDYSWFFVLFLIILWLSGFYRDVLGVEQSDSDPYLLAVASAIFFFASILLHELGHAVVANRRGIPITEITLWLFGGVARMSKDSDSPGTEFKIAAAGPAVTLVLAALCFAIGIGVAGADEFWAAVRLDPDADVSGPLAMIAWLAEINVLVLIFNLIPAFPLDGGRIARAIAWRLSGDRNRATRLAANLGRGISYVLIALGLLLVIGGSDLVVTGIWLALIGFILGQSARGYAMQSEFSSRIGGISVADVMDADPVFITEDTSIERAIDEYFLRYRWPWFPVVDAGEHFRGLLVREAADGVPELSRASQTVGEVFETDASGALRVRDDAPLESLLGNDALRRLGGLAAVDADGRLRGVITADQVGRALRDAVAARP